MDLIMGLLEKEGGRQALGPLQAVCRAWQEAFAAYPVQISGLVMQQKDDIRRLVKIVPGMASLEFATAVGQLDMRSLRACTQLTSLCIVPPRIRSKAEPDLDLSLSWLPESLRSFTVDAADAQLLFAGGPINLPGLTKFFWRPREVHIDQLCHDLRHLPGLKVRAANLPAQPRDILSQIGYPPNQMQSSAVIKLNEAGGHDSESLRRERGAKTSIFVSS